MASDVDICNLALGNIRAGSINSLDEASLEAQVCKQRYAIARDFVLRDFPWRFAHKVQALALLDLSHPEWAYVYDYPSDCLKAKYIVANPNAATTDRTVYYHFDDASLDQRVASVPFAVGQEPGSDAGRVILTNQDDAYLAYTARQTSPSMFHPDFVEALSWYLAAMIAVPVAGAETGRELRKDALKIYEKLIAEAQSRDAQEARTSYTDKASPTIRARGG